MTEKWFQHPKLNHFIPQTPQRMLYMQGICLSLGWSHAADVDWTKFVVKMTKKKIPIWWKFPL